MPALDTVSFDAELPLHFHAAADAARCASAALETRLALAVLAAPNDENDSSPQQQRMEAKLDFALELGLQTRYPQLPAARHCRIGLEAIIWRDDSARTPGSSGLLQLHPHAPSACALHLQLEITASQPDGDGYLHHGRLCAFARDGDTHRWERWVFHQHRQRIGNGAR